MAPPVLAVVGTAGRRDDAARLSRPVYEAMYEETLAAVEAWGVEVMTSGMAAYADHLAVRAYNEGAVPKLLLFAPAVWDQEARRFRPDPSVRFNPGKTLNGYHETFSRRVGIDSLGELAEAVARGASVEVRPGFHARNAMVARTARRLLAFTFGADREPVDTSPGQPGYSDPSEAGLKEGGTAHTWSVATRCDVKRHVSLTELVKRPALTAAVVPEHR